ncbi:Fe3+-hydroxamate ABC transporter substrate-binding protein [Anaerocolumna cellulosilytica]|uniref:Fe3+-hydroxamate ABC transporter substrate-binding protein n=1 Tax=Anaerocolumna cellulosilytica TaxID=433286 RepID=A0A6S6R1L0_9FIRM|nr:ABC transporter substrate-binding protein [Anaerocolumna cellulosilytica]MBB5195320.1 iron complex transport system substrate-binding protein [Anaerocolumna cellulosilytica]BCJ96794.1 Fe3+-hydroxamate ABC transporter substrate-binding protein [Anaerocolumna cellulosilytica]
MKKILSIGATAVLILTVLTGCSNTKNTNTPASTQPTEQATATTAPTFEPTEEETGTRTVSTIKGDIEVPVNPQRVVANWYVGDVITLNLNLVGYNAWAQETMPFYDVLMASTKIETWEPENVMTLEPDLIITYKEDDFDKFNKIAPVLVIPESIESTQRLSMIGEATGRTEEAEAAIQNFETKLAEAKERFNGEQFAGKSFSILEDWGASGDWSGVYYETGSRGGTLVYDYLGLSIPEKLTELIKQSGEGRGSLSYEIAHEYFGDYILWFRQEGKESEYAQTEIWKSIPAVQNKKVAEIPGEMLGLFYYSDVTSLTGQLDYTVNAINSLAN